VVAGVVVETVVAPQLLLLGDRQVAVGLDPWGVLVGHVTPP
jgi:hypothetical protein